jgi:hypothetical protein
MAARDNQGLQIALIIFVMLTIGGVVGTYFYFSRWQEQVAKNKAATDATTAAVAEKDKAAKDKGDLLTLLGAAPTDPVAETIEADRKKIDSYATAGYATLPAEKHNYQQLVETLISTVKTANENRDASMVKMAADKVAADKLLAEANAKADEIGKSLKAAQDQLTEQTTKYNAAVVDLTKLKDQLANDKTLLNKAFETDKAKLQQSITAQGLKIAELSSDLVRAKRELDSKNQPNPAVSGGRILWVNQRDNVAFLSLGSDDNLQRKTTFNVYPQGTANVTNAVPKGKVEVTNVTGTHTSEARIVENPIGDPLLPGDVVHSGEWSPGQHLHYALAGVIDLNGSGTDQTHKMRELIESTGGVVDAEVVTTKGEDGKLVGRVKGAITINTRYLILGDPKVDTPEGAARLQATTTLITEASRLHVDQIGLNKFLGMMGYVAPVGVGPGAAGASNQGTIKGVPNNAFQNSFRPRQPGAGAANAGATP